MPKCLTGQTFNGGIMVLKYSQYARLFLVIAVLLAGSSCKKQTTVIPEPTPEPVVELPPEPEPVDTSDNVSFQAVDLEAEFERKVAENLKTIYFDYNSFTLTQNEISQLSVAGGFLNQYSTVRVLIEGHCDERGSSEYNMGLGENRARVVKTFLINYGIPSTNIEITSWGKERPESYGCTDEQCHSQNRRAGFKVLSK